MVPKECAQSLLVSCSPSLEAESTLNWKTTVKSVRPHSKDLGSLTRIVVHNLLPSPATLPPRFTLEHSMFKSILFYFKIAQVEAAAEHSILSETEW